MLEFTTNQDDKIGSHWLTMGQVDSMVFRVRACSAAIIFFGKRVAVNLDLSSALIIGDEDKRYVSVYLNTREQGHQRLLIDIFDSQHYKQECLIIIVLQHYPYRFRLLDNNCVLMNITFLYDFFY